MIIFIEKTRTEGHMSAAAAILSRQQNGGNDDCCLTAEMVCEKHGHSGLTIHLYKVATVCLTDLDSAWDCTCLRKAEKIGQRIEKLLFCPVKQMMVYLLNLSF